MKKIAISALLAAVMLGATDYNYEISPMAGNVSSNNHQELEDQDVYGAEVQFNDLGTFFKPELSVYYSDGTYNGGRGDTNIFRTALNGVYEFERSNTITPFLKMGAGYEVMSNHEYDNHNGAFGDAGAGVKIALAEQIAVKLEVIDMVKFNNFNWDNNLLLLAGLNFAFGEKAAPAVEAAPAPAPVAVAEAPAPTPVVPVPVEKCANAPKGFVLDDNCMPLKKSFNINFPFDSAKIIDTEAPKVSEFATFLKDSPAYKTELVGYTDSVGTEQYNQKLSEKRAAAVKAQLEKEGIATDRLSTSGKGEADPVATNKTKEGRWLNRRVDAVLAQ